MYQPYPGGSEQMPEQSRPPVPQSVIRAAQVMYAGAAASLIGIIIDMTTLNATKTAIRQHSPNLTQTQINNAEHFAIGIFIVQGLIGAALWLWMAQSAKAGKNWARVVSTVLFAIDTISVLAGAAAAGVASGGAVRIYGVVVWLIGLAAIILLWQRQSTAFFKSTPRY